MDHKAKGNQGEDLAVKTLEQSGYEILERNYRSGRAEIDVIALLENQLLVFVEVKTRSRRDFGEAETFVSKEQEQLIVRAADDYIHAINWNKDVRFDIMTVDKDSKVEHFQDAFY